MRQLCSITQLGFSLIKSLLYLPGPHHQTGSLAAALQGIREQHQPAGVAGQESAIKIDHVQECLGLLDCRGRVHGLHHLNLVSQQLGAIRIDCVA